MRILLFAIFGSICLAQVSPPPGGGGGGAPSGPAGGVLSGTYPNPGFTSTAIMPGTLEVTSTTQLDGATNVLASLGVGPLNSSLGTLTGSFLNRTATTGATAVYIGSDNNSHTSATSTKLSVRAGQSQSGSLFEVLQNGGGLLFTLDASGNADFANQAIFDLADFRFASSAFKGGSATVFGFTSTNNAGTLDTTLSRVSAGVVAFGTGAQGSIAGSWKATNGTLSGTLTIPTLQPTTSYESVDGTTGATVTTCTGFKNGLCISGT